MNRLKLIDFSEDVRQLLIDLEEIKKAQLLGGDSWIFYRMITGDSSDFSMSGMNIGDVKVFRLTFIPDDPTVTTIADFLLIGTSSLAFRQQIVPVQNADHSWDLRYTANANGFSRSEIVQIMSTQTGTMSVVQVA